MNPCCSGLPQREWGHWVEGGAQGTLYLMWGRDLAHERLSELLCSQNSNSTLFFLLACFLKCNSKGSTFSMTIAQNMIICVRSRQA